MLYIKTGFYCGYKIFENKNFRTKFNKILQVEKGQMERYLDITLSYHQQCMFMERYLNITLSYHQQCMFAI